MSDDTGWPTIPEEEMAAFYETANVFLNTANDLEGQEASERIGAAFLYAAARFAAFAMEAQIGDHTAVGTDTRDFLTKRFEEELQDHALQHLRVVGAAVQPGQVPDAALDVLISLNEMDEAARRPFLQLADQFIGPANDLIADVAIARISAAMMHACTRFNAYVMQTRGLPPGPLDAEIAGDFSRAFRALLDFHLGQSVVTDRGQ